MTAVNAAPGPKRAAEPPVFGGTSRPFIFLKEPLAVQIGPFANAEGKPVTLERYRGKVLLLNFWATWCGPCVHEMPTLDRLQGALGGTKFDVLTLSLDRKGMAVVGPFWEEQGYKHLPILLDSRWKTARRLGVDSLPAILPARSHRQDRRLSDRPGQVGFAAGEGLSALLYCPRRRVRPFESGVSSFETRFRDAVFQTAPQPLLRMKEKIGNPSTQPFILRRALRRPAGPSRNARLEGQIECAV